MFPAQTFVAVNSFFVGCHVIPKLERTLWEEISQQYNRGQPGGGGAGTVYPFNGLYGEAQPEGGTFFRLLVLMKGQGFYYLKYAKGEGSLTLLSVKVPERADRRILGL